MQVFYTRLFSPSSSKDRYWSLLARITKISRAQLAKLESDVVWSLWG
jgi:hypothetical protein